MFYTPINFNDQMPRPIYFHNQWPRPFDYHERSPTSIICKTSLICLSIPSFPPCACLSLLSLHVSVYPFFPSMCLSIPFFPPCICLSLCVIQTCYQNGYKGWPSLRRHNKIFYIVFSLSHLTHCLKPLHRRPIAYDQSNDTSSQWLC